MQQTYFTKKDGISLLFCLALVWVIFFYDHGVMFNKPTLEYADEFTGTVEIKPINDAERFYTDGYMYIRWGGLYRSYASISIQVVKVTNDTCAEYTSEINSPCYASTIYSGPNEGEFYWRGIPSIYGNHNQYMIRVWPDIGMETARQLQASGYSTDRYSNPFTVVGESEALFSSEDIWAPDLSASVINLPISKLENFFLYTTYDDDISVVYKRNLLDNSQVKLFEFKRHNGFGSCSVLSPDKSRIAFIDEGGLKVYNTITKDFQILIQEIASSADCSDCPPKWLPQLYAYSLFDVLWSADGKYISFTQGHYEGASLGVFELESGNYLSLNGGSSLDWSPIGHKYLSASASGEAGYEDSGLFVSGGDIKETKDISLGFLPKNTEFYTASFSPDTKKIAFVYSDPGEYERSNLSVVNVDGTDFSVLLENANILNPVFSKDQKSIFFSKIESRKQIFVKYDIASKRITGLVILPNTDYKIYLMENNMLLVQGSRQVYILDVTNKKIIYSSPVSSLPISFLGLSN